VNPARSLYHCHIRGLAAFLAAFLLSSCTVGPPYTKPPLNVPPTYRAETSDAAKEVSLGEAKWWEVFQDPDLQTLIRTALEQNYDVRIAANRVVQAQAQLGITRADQFPTITGGASALAQRTAQNKLAPAFELNAEQVTVSLAWEPDFWGQFRSATEAARANLLATEWGRRAVISTIVANVAAAYFQLRELDLELDISRKTLASRRDSLRLVSLQEQHGAVSMLDVHQSEQLVYTASAEIPDLERQIQQEEDFISILLGQNPGPVKRGLDLTAQPHPPEIPAGLPSSLLERRPDIQQAEQQLIAFNAQIGVARAAYFPQITLTSQGGFQSAPLSDLFSGPAGMWSFVGALTQPIFTAGKIRSTVRLAEAQKQQAVLVYQQIIQEAFREVSDALIAYSKTREFREQATLLASSAGGAARLSDMRYRGGAASYLEVLTNETNYFSAQLGLAQAQLNELLAMVQLYNSLGGGWQQ
jgi:multidrug efflux system outer membrane protein